MIYQELNEVLERLNQATISLEETYIENEGEVTEETEMMESEIEDLKDLLTGEGVDLLGRWLKGKEDLKASIKAEKDFLTRRIASIDKSIEFIKTKINQVLTAIGEEKVKGFNGYSFQAYQKTSTTVNKDVLNEMFQEKVSEALAGLLPSDVTVSLGASVSKVEGDLPAYYTRTITPSTKFTKPRASKEA